MRIFNRFLRDESVATAIEYGLIAAGISVAIIAVVTGLGSKLQTTFTASSATSGLGAVKHREFAMASGEMTRGEFRTFLSTIFANMASVSVDRAIHFICMDWRHMEEVITAGSKIFSTLKNLCVWSKDNGGMGSFYRSKHELFFVYKVGEAPRINTVELGRSDRYRTNAWDYAGVRTWNREAIWLVRVPRISLPRLHDPLSIDFGGREDH